MRLYFKILLWTVIAVLPGGFVLLPLVLRRAEPPRPTHAVAVA
jgi:hypothetical protein